MVDKWISLDTVLSDLAMSIPTSSWSEANAREWSFQAMRKIGLIDQYDADVEFLTVEEYRTTLPKNYYMIELMAYKLNTTELTADEMERIRLDLRHDNDLYYTGFTANSLFFSQYKPLRLSKSPFAISVHCTDCINIYAVSEHTYVVHPNNTLTVSFPEGNICLAYRKYATDCDGNYLIPDDQDYIDAVRSYVLMRIWELRMNTNPGEKGIQDMFMMYSQKWSVLRPMVVGKLMLPSVDQMENLRQTNNRLVNKERDYYRAFANRFEENTDF